MTGTYTSLQRRSAGILLHITSLPGPFGVGDLGPMARTWIDRLADANQTWWQILPLNPVGPGGSPYSSDSAFAGNPLLISPDDLCVDGLLRSDEIVAAALPQERVDYPRVSATKTTLFTQAWTRFRGREAPHLLPAFEAFCETTPWLNDYSLFATLKQSMPSMPGRSWADWPSELAAREPNALAEAMRDLSEVVDQHRFVQFLFARQLDALRQYAAERGVKLLGDMPMFVSIDSTDVWIAPHLFALDSQHRLPCVAGAPADSFSKTGQCWGLPLYNWDAMAREGFHWWIERVRTSLRQVDAIRLDHFRGFEAFWEIPANLNANCGRWVKGPGAALFEAIHASLGEQAELPFAAEDLGDISPEVDALREQLRLPGLRVLQFGFGSADERRFQPHTFERNVIACTGTHDTDTVRGWYDALPSAAKEAFHHYAPEAAQDPVQALVRLAWASVADTAIVPLQDVLGLGSVARMNVPSGSPLNWSWRAKPEELESKQFEWLREVTGTYGRSRCNDDRSA